MSAPDAQPPTLPLMWWTPSQQHEFGLIPAIQWRYDGSVGSYVEPDDLPADAVRLVPAPAVPGPDALRAFADDIEQRMPTLRDPDPLSDWSLGVVWAVDRARNMADSASAALAGTTTPGDDEDEDDGHGPWTYTEFGTLCSCGYPVDKDERCTRPRTLRGQLDALTGKLFEAAGNLITEYDRPGRTDTGIESSVDDLRATRDELAEFWETHAAALFASTPTAEESTP